MKRKKSKNGLELYSLRDGKIAWRLQYAGTITVGSVKGYERIRGVRSNIHSTVKVLTALIESGELENLLKEFDLKRKK